MTSHIMYLVSDIGNVVSTKSEDLINFVACSYIFASNIAVKVVRDMVPGG